MNQNQHMLVKPIVLLSKIITSRITITVLSRNTVHHKNTENQNIASLNTDSLNISNLNIESNNINNQHTILMSVLKNQSHKKYNRNSNILLRIRNNCLYNRFYKNEIDLLAQPLPTKQALLLKTFLSNLVVSQIIMLDRVILPFNKIPLISKIPLLLSLHSAQHPLRTTSEHKMSII